MEQIIILIAIGLLSTLFSKKNKGEQKQEPERPQAPTVQQTVQPTQKAEAPRPQQSSSEVDPFKRLKEMTGEIYKEFQEEQRRADSEQAQPAEPAMIGEIQITKEEPTFQPTRPDRPSVARKEGRSGGRLSVHQTTADRTRKTISTKVDITNEQDVLKGIIFSEILGPPKSKQ